MYVDLSTQVCLVSGREPECAVFPRKGGTDGGNRSGSSAEPFTAAEA
jgi:hypothetical protein